MMALGFIWATLVALLFYSEMVARTRALRELAAAVRIHAERTDAIGDRLGEYIEHKFFVVRP